MTDLRDRLRDLDSLDVPDVMQQARRLGPKPPMEQGHPARPARRIAIAAFALLLAATSVLYVTRAFDRGEAPVPAVQTPAPPLKCRWTTTDLGLKVGHREAARLVAGSSMSDLWVVASRNPWIDQYLLHNDGQGWNEVPLPKDLARFYSGDMVANAPNDVWLLAPHGVARFDGRDWIRSDFPGLEGAGPGEVEFLDLEVTAPDDAWVTGNLYDRATETWSPAILHWDGSAWDWSYRGSTDADAPSRLVAVSAWGPNDVWAAGIEGGRHPGPVTLHWDGTAWTTRPVHGPGVQTAPIDSFGLAAIGPDDALMTVDRGVVRWDGGRWLDTGFEAPTSQDVPVAMEQGSSGVWAKVWNTGAARWNGETWQQESLGSLYSYGMTVIDGTAVFVGAGPRAEAIEC